jgi:hypothetical protein
VPSLSKGPNGCGTQKILSPAYAKARLSIKPLCSRTGDAGDGDLNIAIPRLRGGPH